MKKCLFLLLTMFCQMSLAHAEAMSLCSQNYQFEMFSTRLQLAIDTQQSVMILDRHIPYGIRPFDYKISKAACDKNKTALQIIGTSQMGDTFVFNFQANGNVETQSGMGGYLHAEGAVVNTKTWDCSLQAMKDLCNQL